MSSSIVVTGAAGFIGRNTVAALNDRGHNDILLVDVLGTDEKWQTLVGLEFDDLISPQAFLDRLDDRESTSAITTVIHLGACSATTEMDADYLLANNYHYTRTLCEWARARDVRLIYASSAATYGGGELGFSDDDSTTRNLRPLNMYGYSKQLVDLWGLRTGALGTVAGLKFFNVFGPHEQHKGDMRSVVSKAYDEIRTTGRLSLFKSYRAEYADGQQERDFIYVRDAVDVVLFLLDNPTVAGLFNCGSGTARTWADLAAAVFAAMGLPTAIDYVDMPDGLREKYQYHTEAPMDKLRSAGYHRPFHSLEEGVSEYVTWLTEHLR
jgi:ADP-L-glycero-D-manno-heptose 6-epimerase